MSLPFMKCIFEQFGRDTFLYNDLLGRKIGSDGREKEKWGESITCQTLSFLYLGDYLIQHGNPR